jgi:hypothetical protein
MLRALRWHLVLLCVARVRLIELWLINAASGLVNFLIPLRTAELAKSLFLRQRYRIPFSSSLTSAAYDRIFDLLSVVVLGFTGALLGMRLDTKLIAILIAGGILLLTIFVLLFLTIVVGGKFPHWLQRQRTSKLGEKMRGLIVEVSEQVLRVVNQLKENPGSTLPVLGLSLTAALMDAVLLQCLFLSLGANPPFLLVLTAYALFTLTFLLPSVPGYVGSMEALGSLVFCALGVEATLAASVVILQHALVTFLLGMTGGLSMLALGVPTRALMRAMQEDNIPTGSIAQAGSDR